MWQTLQIAVKISAHVAPALVERNSEKLSLPMPTVCNVSFVDTEICNRTVQATDSKQDVCFLSDDTLMPSGVQKRVVHRAVLLV